MTASISSVAFRLALLCLLAEWTVGQLAASSPAPVPSNNPASQSPCLTNGAYTRLDFWLGTWDVVDDTGAIAGSAVIQKTLGGCAIQCQWKDPDGSETLEIFYYAAGGKQWRQLLVSDFGRTMERKMTGDEMKPNRVRFEGIAPRMNGKTFMDRSTVTVVSGQEVHQLIERSLDGKEWQTSFNARYRRRNAAR